MNEMGQQLCPLYDPWPRASEVRVCIYSVNSPAAHGRQIVPASIVEKLRSLRHDLIQIEPTGRDNEDFRGPFQNIVPGDANRIGAFTAQRVHAAGYFDHLWHPVPTAVNGIDPFHTKDPRTVCQAARYFRYFV